MTTTPTTDHPAHRIDVVDDLYAEGHSAAPTTDDPRYTGGVYGWFCIEADDEDHLVAELTELGFTPDQIAAARS
jgi:hypothetical protein